MTAGLEWVVDAYGCSPETLCSHEVVTDLAETLLAGLALSRVAPPLVHVFPDPGGLTAMYLLAESHLCVHTFPEHGLLTLNLYCCRPRPPFDFEGLLAERLGAERVLVRSLVRGA